MLTSNSHILVFVLAAEWICAKICFPLNVFVCLRDHVPLSVSAVGCTNSVQVVPNSGGEQELQMGNQHYSADQINMASKFVCTGLTNFVLVLSLNCEPVPYFIRSHCTLIHLQKQCSQLCITFIQAQELEIFGATV